MKQYISFFKLTTSDRLLGALLLFLALASLIFWFPADIDTGLVENVRRRNVIGDSLAPTLAMILIGLSALSLIRQSSGDEIVSSHGKWHRHFVFFIIVLICILLLMRYTGPIVIPIVNSFGDGDLTYRNLRNIRPLKYLGYVAGGTLLLCSFSHFMDKSLTRKRAFLFFGISITIALFFDLPFEDILLPPNGDV